MHNNSRFIFLLIITALILPVLWAGIVVKAVGFELVFNSLSGGGSSLVFAAGAFGSSFGILAAVFAGLAVALLWQNLQVSQEELRQLRSQMEIDRDLNTFTQFMDLLQSIRANLRNYDSSLPDQKGKEVIQYYALKLQEIRQGGDFDVDDSLATMKRCFHDNASAFYRHFSLSVSEYCRVCIEIAKFLARISNSERQRLTMLLHASLSFEDYIVLHEYFIVNTDPEFDDVLNASGLFREVGLPLRVVLRSGPFFSPAVYGEKVAAAVEEGKL